MRSRKVEIIPSYELGKFRLRALIGKRGVVVAEGKGSGLWIELDEPYQDEKEWFIPYKSIQVIHSNV